MNENPTTKTIFKSTNQINNQYRNHLDYLHPLLKKTKTIHDCSNKRILHEKKEPMKFSPEIEKQQLSSMENVRRINDEREKRFLEALEKTAAIF